MNEKLKGLEQDLADEKLEQALQLDVDQEVQRRYETAKRSLEVGNDISEMASARSGVSASKDSSLKPGMKKQVHFAKPETKKPQPNLQVDKVSDNDDIGESINENIMNSGSNYSEVYS